jgi:hypothetical protein
MRVFHRGNALYLWRNIQLVWSRVLLFILLLVMALILSVSGAFPYASIGLALIPLAYLLGVYSYKSYLTWVGGSAGEELVSKSLMGLDDSYLLINGVVVPPNRGDTDHIILGPNGVFVIESKNYGGRISCDGDAWRKSKVVRGVSQNLEIGSPSNQLKRNAKVLKDFLLAHQEEVFGGKAPHLWVHGLLVFTNSDAELELHNPSVDVVELDELCGRILSAKSEFLLSPKQVEAMGGVIVRYCR